MSQFEPKVNPVSEFLEISNDFTDPKEIIREAISNAFDANADSISITVVIDKTSGENELTITIKDNGHGMNEETLKDFFGLGFSTRPDKDEHGYKIGSSIGEKGHGAKIFFNGRCIEVNTISDGTAITAQMNDPIKSLRAGKLPCVSYQVTPGLSANNGTTITIKGYNNNRPEMFAHVELKDYIYWFTKFGSVEKEFGIEKFKNVTLYLSGLGWTGHEPEPLAFGHRFAKVNNILNELKQIDKVEHLEWFVARWPFTNIALIGYPSIHIDFIFYIEGDKAKRAYNKMIYEKKKTGQGEYNVGHRYGLWLCKDYFAIDRRNDWISERNEWTKYHAFVNCQEFRLTANRSDLSNTPPEIMQAVKTTVKNLFHDEIMTHKDFKKYKDELQRQKENMSTIQEEQDFDRRRKLTLKKRTAECCDLELFEPRQESGVFSLFLQLITKRPDLFDFKIVDYDTSVGYDLLVTDNYDLELSRAALKFVEMKFMLQRSFNHSFKKLSAIICWDTNLANDDTVHDLSGEERTLKITPKAKNAEQCYSKYMLVTNTEAHNIEIFVLKDYLKEKLNCDFRPRTALVDFSRFAAVAPDLGQKRSCILLLFHSMIPLRQTIRD
ncbi:MAG: ATP-binding protein [Nitrospirae bacterium]|nr:ATP-binding protein [Nitrospirota bacterium]